ncbi:MAG: preprotein translocase subunit SecG [Candidatus Rifleibacteriota bacterium]
MLAGFVQFIHIIVCIGLIVIVLLQADKGEGLAGAFGGGASSTVFGERGAGGFMSKLTTTMAIVFMITSLIISVWVPRWEESSANSASAVELSSPSAGPIAPMETAAPAAPVNEIPVTVPEPTPAPAGN